jgi:hypothetical protein
MSEDRAAEGRTATILERVIARAQEGSLDLPTVLWTLAASDLVILNDGPPEGGFPAQPLVVGRDGQNFLAVFTHRDLAAPSLTGERVVVHIPAVEVLRRVPAGVGLVVNPGFALGLEVPAPGLRAFTQDVLETAVAL